MAKVSILIPCYNVGEYLPRCLDSILASTYQNLHIVMINDGSKDNTLEVMRRYAERDNRIEFYTQENSGVAATRNRLLSHIKGEYTLFVDSDDWVEPDMIEFLVYQIEKNDADVATCSMMINENKPTGSFTHETLRRLDVLKKFLLHKELRGSLCSKLVKTSLLHKITFDEVIGYGEDALFCWQFLQRIDKAVLTDKQLYHYRMNQTSISHSAFGKQKLTGHRVWSMICSDCDKLYPEFSEIAYGHFAMEDMYLLRDASQRSYPYDSDIKTLQNTVRENMSKAKTTGQAGWKDLIYAFCITNWYSFGKLYLALHSLKNIGRS